MNRIINAYILFIILIVCNSDLYSQIADIKNNKFNVIYEDSILSKDKRSKISIGGIFISPSLGINIPVRDFAINSKNALNYGIKIEFAHSKIYPFVPGILYQFQNYKGKDDFLTSNYLNSMESKIQSFGVSLDILLNVFLKSEFTIPILNIEGNYLTVTRNIDPVNNNLNFKASDNLIGFTAGMGFTLYIFDIIANYVFAREYSSASIKTRIHFPLIKF
jgi:hypothetical protein